MNSELNLTTDEIIEIERLVNCAITAENKKSAKHYVDRLKYMQSIIDISPYKNNIFTELIIYVIEASGNVREKDHWVNVVNQSLYILKAGTNK